MNRKRIYNRVMDDRSGVCPLGELLTDKELERMRRYCCNLVRDWPKMTKSTMAKMTIKTAKVAVKTGEIYFSFGVRFAKSYELIKQDNNKPEHTNMTVENYKFEYMLLSRLQSDCDYYLGNGGRNAKHSLWAQDEQKQINKMRELYDLLPVKPEWLTREQIDKYAAEMNAE